MTLWQKLFDKHESNSMTSLRCNPELATFGVTLGLGGQSIKGGKFKVCRIDWWLTGAL